MDDKLVIAGKEFDSRLMVGTGRHRTNEEMVESIEASGAEIITVAIRRLDLDNLEEKNILDYFDWDEYTILPNTAGCKTAEEAVFTARLAREVTGSDWIKLEVIPFPEYLLPDPRGTYDAAKQLIEEGFTVLPYIHADPVLAKHLEEIGCATVMPLGSAIGSGQGVQTLEEINLIIRQSTVPVVVDAGLGRAFRRLRSARSGRRRRSGQHRHSAGRRPGGNGRGVQARRAGGKDGVQRRTHSPPRNRRAVQPGRGSRRRDRLTMRPRLPSPCLCLVTDRNRTASGNIVDTVSRAVSGGVGMVQLREKDLPARALLDLAKRLRAVTTDKALLIVNDRVDVALLCDADGVQLGEDGLDVAAARELLGHDRLIGRSVHSIEGAVAAELEGADYLVLGTIFPTASHPGAETGGLDLVRAATNAVRIPVLGIGGITAGNAAAVMDAGASGIAVITAITLGG